ncbi:MAG: urease accessory protein UreF [Chitinophagaceae bacterium]
MNNALFHLLHLADPTLPVGGFSHSAGLETCVQAGIVKDAATAKEFVEEMVSKNLHYTDAAFVSLAYDAAGNSDWNGIRRLDEECNAVKLPKEVRLASQKMGTRVLKIFQPLCQHQLIDQYAKSIKEQQSFGHYCIAFGLLANVMRILKKDTLTGFYYNAAVGFVTNCVKLIPLSQQHGQAILFSLQPLLDKLSEENLQPDEEKIGLCCSAFDIRSMQHERLYSRLYMS